MVRMIAGRLITESTEDEAGVVVVNPTVTWNPSASAVEITLKDWNRGFELGDLSEWTQVNAEISTEDPYDGIFCVDLTQTGAYILQTLDEPVPVYAVYEFSAWVRRPNGVVAHFTLRMHHTDGTTNDVAGSLTSDGWERVYFERSYMNTSKILSAVSVRSYAVDGGQLFVDNIFLGIANEIIAGSVETLQAIPESLQAEVIARPKGGVLETDSVTTQVDPNWQTVVEYPAGDDVLSSDWKFELAKILVSCPNAVIYRLRWGTTVISAEVYVTGGIPFTDWFPWNYYYMRGDGTKTFNIQVMFPAGGAAAVCHAEIVGEYVAWQFNTPG